MKRKKILLIDDEKHIVDAIKERLTANGYSVITAENGKVGLERLKTAIPDLIVLDVLMPEMDGFEFIKTIRSKKEYAGIPTLMLTARYHMRDTFELYQADEFIVKPFEVHDLLVKIDFLLKFRVLLLSDDSGLISIVRKAVSARDGILEAVDKEDLFIQKARKYRYGGIIIHLQTVHQKPGVLIQETRKSRNAQTTIVAYFDSGAESANAGSREDVYPKREWGKAGIDVFFDPVMAKEHFAEAFKKIFE